MDSYRIGRLIIVLAAAVCVVALVVPACAATPAQLEPTLWWTMYQEGNCSNRAPPPRGVVANGSCIRDTRAMCSVDAVTGLITANLSSYLSDGSCNATYYGNQNQISYTTWSWTAVAANSCVPVSVSSSDPSNPTYIEESSIFCTFASQDPDSNGAAVQWRGQAASTVVVGALAAALLLSASLM